MNYLKGLCARLIESLMIGVIVEIIFSFLWMYIAYQSVFSHFENMYEMNNNYLAHNPMINHYLWSYVSMAMNDVLAWAKSLSDSYFQVISLLIYAVSVVLQKILIAIASLPLYIICIIVGSYDGLVGRELRRYRAGIESTRRERFEKWVRHIERFVFIGYVSIPVFIHPILWFLPLGILVACIHRMSIVYTQKYI